MDDFMVMWCGCIRKSKGTPGSAGYTMGGFNLEEALKCVKKQLLEGSRSVTVYNQVEEIDEIREAIRKETEGE